MLEPAGARRRPWRRGPSSSAGPPSAACRPPVRAMQRHGEAVGFALVAAAVRQAGEHRARPSRPATRRRPARGRGRRSARLVPPPAASHADAPRGPSRARARRPAPRRGASPCRPASTIPSVITITPPGKREGIGAHAVAEVQRQRRLVGAIAAQRPPASRRQRIEAGAQRGLARRRQLARFQPARVQVIAGHGADRAVSQESGTCRVSWVAAQGVPQR
jgi:hypothetical protein